ncbi:hypothetical protein N499_0928A, partial [Wolbachia pipientis wVitA]
MTSLSSSCREPSYRDSFAVSQPLTSSGILRDDGCCLAVNIKKFT